MFVLDVIPLSRGAPPGLLSYRFPKRLAPGTLVLVPLRKKTVRGLVVKSASVISERAALRAAPFMLRAGAARAIGKLPPALMKAAEYAAHFHVLSPGATLALLVSESLPLLNTTRKAKGIGFKKEFLEIPALERMTRYRERAEMLFKQKRVLLIVSPTTLEARQIESALVGVSGGVTLIAGSLPAKARDAALRNALLKKGGVVVQTAPYGLLPIVSLGAIVLEREGAGAWISQAREGFDYRVPLEAFAKELGVPLVCADYPLRIETRPHPERPLVLKTDAHVVFLDAREKKIAGGFTAIHPELLAEVGRVIKRGGRAALLAARRGYASAVVCRDCGNAVRDARGMPLSLARERGKPVFRSADGKTVKSAEALCDVCGSWNLVPLGIGVERVAEELRKVFPHERVIGGDADALGTPAATRRVAADISKPGTLLVGTEALVPLLDPATPFDLIGIASADSLLSLPFWRSHERLLRVGLALTERAKRVVIASRRPDDPVFSGIKDPTKTNFFKEETELRRVLGYPPFVHLISFSYTGTPGAVEKMTESLRTTVLPYELVTFPSRLDERGATRGSARIRVPKDAWPESGLLERLGGLPRPVHIRIDSESL